MLHDWHWSFFYKHTRLYYVRTKNSRNKVILPVSIEPLDLQFQFQNSPFWANLAFACKTEILGSLYSHALLIQAKSSKFKNQVVDGQKFKIF